MTLYVRVVGVIHYHPHPKNQELSMENETKTDIRTTSYDELSARPFGYQGTIDDVIGQIRSEPDTEHQGPRGRTELRHFLGVAPKHLSVSNGPSLEDDDVQYGSPEPTDPSFYTLDYAMRHWPWNFDVTARPRNCS